MGMQEPCHTQQEPFLKNHTDTICSARKITFVKPAPDPLQIYTTMKQALF